MFLLCFVWFYVCMFKKCHWKTFAGGVTSRKRKNRAIYRNLTHYSKNIDQKKILRQSWT